jgi:hypothetical protein
VILALDPGSERTGAVLWTGTKVAWARADLPNDHVLEVIQAHRSTQIVAEWIEHYGPTIHAGADVYKTCRWIGRMEQRALDAGAEFHTVTRREVKLHLCGSMRAKDPDVRTALVDRFGGEQIAKGRKASPGPLFGVSSHAWSALAVAITFDEQTQARRTG